MPRLEQTRFKDGSPASVIFKCPGCGRIHALYTQHTPAENIGPKWTFNDDFDRPVLSPSILARWESRSAAAKEKSQAFYAEHGRYPTVEELPSDVKHVCHSFVGCNGAQPGQIIFLGDCTHEHAGEVMDLTDLGPDGVDFS